MAKFIANSCKIFLNECNVLAQKAAVENIYRKGTRIKQKKILEKLGAISRK